MYKMKQDLKNLAADIKNGKSGRKPKNRNDMNAKDYQNLYYARRQFRHLHILTFWKILLQHYILITGNNIQYEVLKLINVNYLQKDYESSN